MSHDYALTDDGKGGILAHRVDCPAVQLAREHDKPVMTLFDCERELPKDVARHECLMKSTS